MENYTFPHLPSGGPAQDSPAGSASGGVTDFKKWQMLGLAKLKISCMIQNSKKGGKEIPTSKGQSPAMKPGAQASRWGVYRGAEGKRGVKTRAFRVIICACFSNTLSRWILFINKRYATLTRDPIFFKSVISKWIHCLIKKIIDKYNEVNFIKMKVWNGGWQLHPIYFSVLSWFYNLERKKNPGYRDKLLQMIIVLFNQLLFNEDNLQLDSNNRKAFF